MKGNHKEEKSWMGKLGDRYFIEQAKKGSKGAKECCKKYGLDYEDDNSEDS